MLNVPNTITMLRFVLVPFIAQQLLAGAYDVACVLFIITAISDWADGEIARRWNLRTRFGAIADPLADKLTMLTVTLILTFQHLLPWWLTAAVIARDVMIVVGALAFHYLIGHVEMAPSRISKWNTALAFVLLLLVLAIQAKFLPYGLWLGGMFVAMFMTTLISGAQYVYEWGHKAHQFRRVI